MIFKNSNMIFEQIIEIDNLKNRKLKNKAKPFQPFGFKTEPHRKKPNWKKNWKPKGLDVQKPNGSVFASVFDQKPHQTALCSPPNRDEATLAPERCTGSPSPF